MPTRTDHILPDLLEVEGRMLRIGFEQLIVFVRQPLDVLGKVLVELPELLPARCLTCPCSALHAGRGWPRLPGRPDARQRHRPRTACPTPRRRTRRTSPERPKAPDEKAC